MRESTGWALFVGVLIGACIGAFIMGAHNTPYPHETDTGSEFDLIGNNIQRTVDLEMGNVCYKDAYRSTMSCVKL